MSEQITTPNLIVITAKRLDAEEVTETVAKVESPGSEIALRRQLTVLVAALYPEAEFRSYANEAATFLAPKLLVVAVYRPGEGNEDDAGEGDDSQQHQQQLFAA